MADIFDQIEAPASGDVFDEIAPERKDIFDEIAGEPVVRSAVPGSIAPQDLLPAVRKIGGAIAEGQPGDTHPDIIDRENIPATAIDQRGFTGPNGEFYDREAAARATGLPTQREPGRLHSTDLIAPDTKTYTIKTPRMPVSGELSTTYGGPPKSVPEGAMQQTVADIGEQIGAVASSKGIPFSEIIPEVKPDDSVPMAVGKEAAKLVLGVPEFLTSSLGIASVAAGAVAPTAVAGLFTADMLGSLGNQILRTYKDWDNMTAAQKAAAITDMVGTGAMTAMLAKGTAKGIRAKIGPKSEAIVPEVPAPTEPVPEPIAPKPAEAAVPVAKPRTLTPAVRADDNASLIMTAQDHGTAKIQMAREHATFPTKPQNEGFLDENGNWLSRSEAATRFEEITGKKPNVADALQSEDLKRENMLGHLEKPSATPEAVAKSAADEIGFTLSPEKQIGGVKVAGLPPEIVEKLKASGQTPTYEFTDQRPDSPTKGVTFYVPEGATKQQILDAYKAKVAEFEKAKPTTPTAPKPAEPVAAPVAPETEPVTTRPAKTPEVIAAEEASQAAFEKLGAAEKGAYDKSKRKGMTKPMLAKLAAFDKLVEAEKAAKAAAKASKPTQPTTGTEPIVGMGGARAGEAAPGAQIEQLTQSIENISQQKQPVAEQVKQAFNLGERVAAAKDAIGRAVSGLKTAGDLIIKKWQGVENIDDLLRAKGDLSHAIESRGWRLRQWEVAAKRAIPNPRDQAAIAKWVDAGGDRATLERGLAEAPAQFKRAYQDALNLSGDKLTAAQNVQNYFEARLQEAIDAGVLEHGIENYIHRMYADRPSLLNKALAYTQTGLLKTNPGLAKKRAFQFDWEAEKAGYTPVQSFIKRITAYEASLSKAIAAREFIKKASEMRAADGRPIVDIKGVGIPVEDPSGVREATLIKPKFNPAKNNEEFLPSGAKNPNYRGDYDTRDYRALSRWKWAGTDAGGKPIMVQGDVAIHPDYVGRVDALLKPSQVRFGPYGKILRPMLGASSVMKQTMLDLSGFHQVQITVHGMEHKVMPWRIIKDINLSDPNVDSLLRGGVTLGGDYHGNYKEGLVGTSLTRKIPGLGNVMESYHQWLFQDYIPRIKMTMALHALERNRARFGGQMSDEAIIRKTANQANAAFGELNYTMLERSKTAQDMSRLILLAPDFLEARGRFAAQAFERGGKGVPGIGGNEQRMALLLGALTMYTTARIANKLIDGQYHNEPENLFNIVKDGHAYGLRTVQGDILHLVTKPMQFIMSRLNPVYGRTLLEALTGRDYFGRKRSAAEQVWDAASTTIPISLRSNRERTLWESLANGFGVTARRYSEVDDAFKLAQKWKDKNAIPERGEFIYDPEKDVLRPLKLALNHGDEVGAAAEIKKLLDSKVYTLKKLDEYFKRYGSMPFTGSKANDKKFVQSLTADQRATVEAARQHKSEIRKLYLKSKGQYLAPPSSL